VDAAENFQHDAHEEASPGTLGEVLYAGKAKRVASEQDWVALVHRIADADQMALHALYERAHHLVFTLAMRLTGSRESAEEVTLDVFYDVWRRAGRYDPANGTVLGWVMNQARSRAIDRLRFEQRKKRVDPGTGELPQEQGRDSLEAVQAKQQCEAVRAALTVLSAEERSAIEAAYFSGLTYAEVAARLDAPLGTVKTRIRSGLQKLRRALAAKAGLP
jgi:RNA polymerase sigma-70 factor (ECF subfamily)